jgi:hypothetical protein
MATIELTLQNVNGDPFTTGSNINITTGTTPAAVFNETSGSVSLSTVLLNDTVTIGGFTYSYEYLGSGNVRGDVDQLAAFIRITSSPPGAPLSVGTTFAIDLTGQPGDANYPNLQNGNTQLTVAGLDTSTPTPFPGVPCFVAGTLIQTFRGAVAVEDLQVGDRVLTMDCGYQPICWIGGRRLSRAELEANPKLTPIRIRAGALGAGKPDADLLVSPQHRVLVRSKIAKRVFDNIEVLIPANKLTTIDGIETEWEAQGVEYFHMLFDAHQIVFANGAPTESLFTGPEALKAMSLEARVEIETLFPEISAPGFVPVPVRPIPEMGRQVKVLAQRHKKNKQPLLLDFA